MASQASTTHCDGLAGCSGRRKARVWVWLTQGFGDFSLEVGEGHGSRRQGKKPSFLWLRGWSATLVFDKRSEFPLHAHLPKIQSSDSDPIVAMLRAPLPEGSSAQEAGVS